MDMFLSPSLDVGVHGKNIHVGLGKANNNNNKATTKENFISSYFLKKQNH